MSIIQSKVTERAAKVILAPFNSLVNVALLNAGANLALSVSHRGAGTQSVEFDKVAGDLRAGVSYTSPTTPDITDFDEFDELDFFMLLPTPAAGVVVSVYVALGTDANNYFLWNIPLADLQYDQWAHYRRRMGDVGYQVGVGANLSAITFIAVYIQTSVVATTLANVRLAELGIVRTNTAFITNPASDPVHVDVIAGGGLKADLRQVLGQDADIAPGNELLTDPSDRAARLLGIIYGDLGQMNQLVPADALAPGNALSVAGFNFIYNGATWDMVREGSVAGSMSVEDTGVNTNPERYRQDNHWDSQEVTIAAIGVGGQQNLGAVVGAGVTRRIREITIRHAGTNNTVVTILIGGGATVLTIDVPAQTTRVWSSQDGRAFTATQQPAAQTSDVTGGSTFVSASGLEA